MSTLKQNLTERVKPYSVPARRKSRWEIFKGDGRDDREEEPLACAALNEAAGRQGEDQQQADHKSGKRYISLNGTRLQRVSGFYSWSTKLGRP